MEILDHGVDLSQKEDGWQAWLEDHGLMDSNLTEDQAYIRYCKFS